MSRPTRRPAANDQRAPALDADVLGWLDAAVDPEPLDAAAHARVKSRLLQRIAADSTPRHLTVRPEQGTWRDIGPGLALKVLHRDGDVMSYLVRMAPGSELPPHRHPIDEECVVLEGEVQVGALRVPRGGFHLGRKDVLHEPVRSEGGALVFLRGAVPHAALSL